jgi:hypothetical protein
MDGIESMRLTDEISGRLRRTTNPTHLAQHVRLNAKFEYGSNDGGCDRIMTATGTESRYNTLIVTLEQAELVTR